MIQSTHKYLKNTDMLNFSFFHYGFVQIIILVESNTFFQYTSSSSWVEKMLFKKIRYALKNEKACTK